MNISLNSTNKNYSSFHETGTIKRTTPNECKASTASNTAKVNTTSENTKSKAKAEITSIGSNTSKNITTSSYGTNASSTSLIIIRTSTNLPSTISSTPSTISSTPSTISSTPSTISNTPTKTINTPSTIINTPTKISNTPSTISNTQTKINNTPSKISDTPTKINKAPSKISDTPTKIIVIPSKARSTSSIINKILSNMSDKISNTPSNISKTPITIPPVVKLDRVLNINDKGKDVKLVQDLLLLNGYSLGKYGADSDFGTDTEIAVKSFQKDHGLNDDGKVGTKTMDMLVKVSYKNHKYETNSLINNYLKDKVLNNTQEIKTNEEKGTGNANIEKASDDLITIIDGSDYKKGKSAEERTREFVLRHPFIAADIGSVVHGSNNISTVAVRFATNYLGLEENDEGEGSQVNAFRHVLWQSMITNNYGTSIAIEVGNAHEEHPDALDGIPDFDKVQYTKLSLADEACDLSNNKIGRAIGDQYGGTASPKTLALATLEYYHNYGLWVADESQDGFYSIRQQKLTDNEYETAYKRLITFDEHGYGPNDEKPTPIKVIV